MTKLEPDGSGWVRLSAGLGEHRSERENMEISISEKITVERVTTIDPDSSGFYAWIMFDNHIFSKTKIGTKEEVCEDVRTVHDGDRSMFALWALHHESLDKETKLAQGRSKDMGNMLRPETWGKPHNPFVD